MSDERTVEELKRLYDMLPSIDCKGLCWNSCGPIDMSNAERELIREQGVEIQPFSPERIEAWADNEPLHCAALTEEGRCSVYEVRPLVCRLWGVAESMPCTYGCEPDPGYVRDEDGMRMLAYSMEVGGGVDRVISDRIKELMQDPEVQPLIARLLRGDDGVEAELIELMQQRERAERDQMREHWG